MRFISSILQHLARAATAVSPSRLVCVSRGGATGVPSTIRCRRTIGCYAVDGGGSPSGHSMLSAVVYLTLGSLIAAVMPNRKLKIYVLSVAILLTVIVGISRVYLGVHYPTDVLAGWLAGLVWALLCWLAARWLQNRGQVESEPIELGQLPTS